MGLLFGCSLCLGTLFCAGEGLAGEFNAKVWAIKDGDTLDVRRDGRTQRIRLRGIDCPELKQPYGKQAKRAVDALVTGRTVGVKTYGKDRDGVALAHVYLPDGRDVSRILLQEGLAWRLKGVATPEFEAAEADAQYARRGLWSEPNPVPPWVFRAAKKTGRRS